jgi:hypothetical protein
MFDPFTLLLSAVVFLVYLTVCLVAVLFTFFLDIYLGIDERLNLDLLASRILTPLEINIQAMDDWLKSHNRTVGPLLIILSVIDMKLFFDLINKF